MEPTDNTDLAFVLWRDEVSALCKKHGLNIKDLPDPLTKDDYDSGETPEDFVNAHVLGQKTIRFGPMFDQIILEGRKR